MRNSQLTTRRVFSTNLNIGVYDRLKEYSAKNMIPISKLLDKIITEYLDEQEIKTGS